jgi:hypothetical protein
MSGDEHQEQRHSDNEAYSLAVICDPPNCYEGTIGSLLLIGPSRTADHLATVAHLLVQVAGAALAFYGIGLSGQFRPSAFARKTAI